MVIMEYYFWNNEYRGLMQQAPMRQFIPVQDSFIQKIIVIRLYLAVPQEREADMYHNAATILEGKYLHILLLYSQTSQLKSKGKCKWQNNNKNKQNKYERETKQTNNACNLLCHNGHNNLKIITQQQCSSFAI